MTTPGDDAVTPPRSFRVGSATYSSLEEMPPDVRAKVERVLADRNANGIPDIMEDFVFPPAGGSDAGAAADGGAGYAAPGNALIGQPTDAAMATSKTWVRPAIAAVAIAVIVVAMVLLLT